MDCGGGHCQHNPGCIFLWPASRRIAVTATIYVWPVFLLAAISRKPAPAAATWSNRTKVCKRKPHDLPGALTIECYLSAIDQHQSWHPPAKRRGVLCPATSGGATTGRSPGPSAPVGQNVEVRMISRHTCRHGRCRLSQDPAWGQAFPLFCENTLGFPTCLGPSDQSLDHTGPNEFTWGRWSAPTHLFRIERHRYHAKQDVFI